MKARHPWQGVGATPTQVFAIVCVGIVLANLDLFIVNIGLPKIAQDFKDANRELAAGSARIEKEA